MENENNQKQQYSTFVIKDIGNGFKDNKYLETDQLISILQDQRHTHATMMNEIEQYKNIMIDLNQLKKLKEVIEKKIYPNNKKADQNMWEAFKLLDTLLRHNIEKKGYVGYKDCDPMTFHYYLFEEASKITANFFTNSKDVDKTIEENKLIIINTLRDWAKFTYHQETRKNYTEKHKQTHSINKHDAEKFAEKMVAIMKFHNIQFDYEFFSYDMIYNKYYQYLTLKDIEQALEKGVSFEKIFDRNPLFLYFVKMEHLNFENVFLNKNKELNIDQIQKALELVNNIFFYSKGFSSYIKFEVIDNLLKGEVGKKIIENKILPNFEKIILQPIEEEENFITNFILFISRYKNVATKRDYVSLWNKNVLFNIAHSLSLTYVLDAPEIGLSQEESTGVKFTITLKELEKEFREFLKSKDKDFILTSKTKRKITEII